MLPLILAYHWAVRHPVTSTQLFDAVVSLAVYVSSSL